jgi:peptide/nickel transport system substrate-binding protein
MKESSAKQTGLNLERSFMSRLQKILAILSLTFLTLFVQAQTDPDSLIYLYWGGGAMRPFLDELDPLDAYDFDNIGAVQNLYETLYTFKEGSVNGDLEPLLATGHTLSEDGLTYTFSLREGVVFHSGNPFTCKDIEWSIKRGFAIGSGTTQYFFEAPLLGELYDGAPGFVAAEAEKLGVDTSAEDWDYTAWEGAEAAFNTYWQKLEEAIVCKDDFTLQMTLVYPDAQFLQRIATYAAAVIDSEWAKGLGEWNGVANFEDWLNLVDTSGFLANQVSSTAPYRLLSKEGDLMIAEAFEDYWGEQPELSVVQFKSMSDIDSMFLAVQQGDGDVTSINFQWDLLEGKMRGVPEVSIYEDPNWFSQEVPVMMFNPDINTEGNSLTGSGQLDGAGIPSDFFADPNIRKAFAHSIDSQKLIDGLYSGRAIPLTMVIPPTYSTYDASLPSYDMYDPEKAEEYFKAAFDGKVWETGFEITLVDSLRRNDAALLAIKEGVEDLNPNFKVNVKTITEEEWSDIDENNYFPLLVDAIIADYPDYDYFYDYYVRKSLHVNEAIPPLIVQANRSLELEERKALHKQIAEIGYEDMYVYVLPFNQAFVIANSRVENIYYNPYISSSFYWKHLSKK